MLRFSRFQFAGVCGMSLVLTGCAQDPLGTSLAELARQDLGELDASDRARLDRAGGTQSDIAPTETIDISGAATADDFVAIALEHNPAITAARHRVSRLHERIAQVTSLPDPMLSLTPIGDMAQTATGEVQMMSGVSQRFPFPGKLDAKGRIAQQDVAIADQQLARVRLSVAADTRQAYWSLYLAVRSIEITGQNRVLVTQLREVASAKLRAGTATQEAVLRASVEISNLENKLIELEQRRSVARGALNALLDRPIDSPLPDPAPIEIAQFEAKLADLLDSAERSNPGLQLAREQVGRYREQRSLAALGDQPDFQVGLSYNLVDDGGHSMTANGDDQWWISFGISIPLWQGRTDAAKREATLGILESSSVLASEQRRVAFRVQDAFTRVQTQQRQAELLRDVIVPEASQLVEASLSGYQASQVSFLALIDNWRKLLEFQLMYQSSLAALERSFADLQEAVGKDLSRENIDNDQPSTPDTSSEIER